MQCPKFEQQAAITEKRYKIACQLLLITNRKSHIGFQLVPTSMTLNDVIATVSHFFTECPKNICLSVPVFHFWPKLTHPAARSLQQLTIL